MLAETANARNDTQSVIAALRQASAATGSDFDYLLGTAMRESSLKPQAKSSTSSASGLFQFVDQTWLGLVKQHGAKYGLGSEAAAISQDASGRYHADNAADRQAILALRNDPRTAALMEGEYANDTRAAMESTLGHGVSGGELYAAHFLGPDAACKLIRMNGSAPGACAAEAFPQAARANRSVFYNADGSPKSVRAVYDWAVKGSAAGDSAAMPVRPTHAPAMADAMSGANDDAGYANLFVATSFPATGGGVFPAAPFLLTSDVMDVLASVRPAQAGRNPS